MIEGRTEEQKRAVIEKVIQTLVDAVGAPRKTSGFGFMTCPRRTGALPAPVSKTWGA